MTEPLDAAAHRQIVVPEQDGLRLDKFLAVPGLSRSRLKVLIETGHVRRNGATISEASHPVKTGESWEVRVPPPVPAEPVAQDLPLSIVHEDEDLIVIDKPAGLVVHPAAGNPDGTLVNALIAHCGASLRGVGGVARPGIVHRIDKDTSGLLVVAKHDAAHAGLAAQFADHSVERLYTAFCWGLPSPLSGRIEGAIGRDAGNRKRMAVVKGGGKAAVTHYRVVQGFGTAAARLELRLETGRTHQIRVHLTHMGHPLLGDPVYGRPTQARRASLAPAARDLAATLNRQALHAATLGFEHPVKGGFLRFESPLPADLAILGGALHTS
jgi:23S rRNA pseudouridine1911/1915/1917 synthase